MKPTTAMLRAYTEDQLVVQPELRQFFAEIDHRLTSAETTRANNDQMVEQPDLEQFFADVSYRVELAEATQRRIDQKLATGFNVFNLIEPDENMLSDILADFLNPKGSHGQGDLFLKLLFNKLGLPWASSLAGGVTVQREAPTHRILNHRRRIDVLVEAGALLAIENKVDSLELTDQVKDYLEHLRQVIKGSPKRAVLVYLTPNGRCPTSLPRSMVEKLQADATLYCWSYQTEILAWLDDCHHNCEAERIRYFLSDFIAYIESDLKRQSESDEETSTYEH